MQSDVGARIEMVEFRRAKHTDLQAIIALLAEDELGASREDTSLPVPEAYQKAFAAIDADPNQYLTVITDNGSLIGTFQITIIPNNRDWVLCGHRSRASELLPPTRERVLANRHSNGRLIIAVRGAAFWFN
jgi:hypothetical protein